MINFIKLLSYRTKRCPECKCELGELHTGLYCSDCAKKMR